MTTIISRLYEDSATAGRVADDLRTAGFAESDLDLIAQTGTASAAERIAAAGVAPEAARAYAQHLSADRTLLVVRAGFNPVGAALRAINIVNSQTSVDAGVADENRYLRIEPRRDLDGHILKGAPYMLSSEYTRRSRPRPGPRSWRQPAWPLPCCWFLSWPGAIAEHAPPCAWLPCLLWPISFSRLLSIPGTC